DIDSFEPGNSHPVINPIMGIDERLRIVGKSLDISSPQGASLSIGDKLKTLNQYQSESNKSSQRITELQFTVSRLNTQIGSLSTSLNNAEQGIKDLTTAVEDANLQGIIKSVSDLGNTLKKIEEEIQTLPTSEVILQMQKDIQKNNEVIAMYDERLETAEKTVELNGKSIIGIQESLKSIEDRLTALENGGVKRG
ncbi:lysin, partial [Bacillus sp. K2I17]